MFWGHAAKQCIIDNTNLARLRGSGRQAVIVPEMAAFAEAYGFTFLCHELRHPNRKARRGAEFLERGDQLPAGPHLPEPGGLEPAGAPVATVRMEHRPASKTGLIPAVAFEHECSCLAPLPAELPAPYCSLERTTDVYGYVLVEGNYYWVPGTKREDVKVLRYAERLKIYQQRKCVAEYVLPADGVKKTPTSTRRGMLRRGTCPSTASTVPSTRKQRLRALGPEVAAYVDYALTTPGLQRHRFLRELWALSHKVTPSVFVQALQRALRYRVVQMETLERIAWLCMNQGQQLLPFADVDESFRERPAYQEGCLTDEPDLSLYDEPPGRKNSRGKNNRCGKNPLSLN